jgi:hypothetical protein
MNRALGLQISLPSGANGATDFTNIIDSRSANSVALLSLDSRALSITATEEFRRRMKWADP